MRYEVVGSGEGKKRVMGKGLAVHYAGSDAMLTETEQANYTDLRLVQTLAGAVVLVFNVPDVSKLVLNLDVVTGIYNGTIQTWNHTDIVRLNPQIKLPDANIVPIARADDSGSTRVFTSALSSVSPEWRKHYGTFSEGYNSVTKAPFYWNSSVVKQFGRTTVGAVGLVLSTEFSLSYSSLSEVKSFSINHAWLQNSQGNIVNASIQSVQDAIVSADGNLSIVNTNGSFAYPLSTFTYFIVYMTSMTDCDSAIELVRYITWLSTSEQAAISADRLGFVALEKQTSDLIADHTLKMMTCKGQNVWELMLQQIALENALVEDDSWKTKDIVHGRLTSKCCFIDSTWNLRVTAWNEVCIYKHSRSNTSHNKILPIDWSPEDESSAELLLFTAPEVIKYRSDVTPETDSYSLAMVYQEIFSRKPLYTELSLKPTEILYAVVTCGIRPRITEKTPNVIRLIMERCWEIDQASRPSTASIEVALHKEFPDTVSLLDCMTDTLEQYAVGLETKHNELKAEFEKIKNQINTSLYHNVPAPVADILLNNKKYQCTQYESICLMAFAVCHVENLVVHTTPTGFVNLMTHFFSSLDQVLLNSNLYCLHGQCEYNVYAIGMTFDSDATGYNATKAAIEAVKASKNIFNFTRKFSAERLSGINAELMLKFAITLGPAITGVVKTKQPKFSVFGKAMEEVRDLCANSSAGNIRLAPSVFQTFRAVNEETIHIQEVNEQKQYYIDIGAIPINRVDLSNDIMCCAETDSKVVSITYGC
ncbi:receptor-type guanylate cyclase gcy-21-like [Dreissena polymorpha]|uniref:receptor-type guanylate cyclase gcy-21-like n=1 Tax=Dreissena polymorpha TaxID=45954 RepID=UPI00226406FB|nr:receptor-type guanylate cyclase gcy-21-like [Dreissena polymorpha]